MRAREKTIRHPSAVTRIRALAGRIARRARTLLARAVGRRAGEGELASRLARLEGELTGRVERHGEQIERLEDFLRELIVSTESLRRGVAEVRGMARPLRPLLDELYALPFMADSPFESMQSPVGEVLGFRLGGRLAAEGAVYAAFEDLFRGSAERVSESMRPYLSLVRDHHPVLDLGCGRGEFLALLAAEGIPASGVDSDRGMVARCLESGLLVSEGDLNEFLAEQPDGSLGTVFSSQVIEHLPYAELQRLLALSLSKLRPGGLFIAETVNPHRLASLKNFWVDMTHQHPIFPEVALASCAIAGFAGGYAFAPGWDSYEQGRFSAPAYAVVAEVGFADGEAGR
jgi:SAM-dependent methyltransferase